jgi:glutamate synthase domain-containing protein 2
LNGTVLQPEFLVRIDEDRCDKCKRCLEYCGFGTFSFNEKIVPDHFKCVACHRCVTYCPHSAITVVSNPLSFKEHPNWTPRHIQNIFKQSETGGMLLTGMGNDLPYPVIFDRIVLDACQVTNPSIDPLREPMELRTYLGRKPDTLTIRREADGAETLETDIENNIRIDIPIVFAPMSYGSISLNAMKAIVMAAERLGTIAYTGEGGLPRELYPYGDKIILQCASGRFGVSAEYLDVGIGTQIKIGQGAKPGIGGHLPGEKIPEAISETRMIPVGTDALSPAPQHDIYSIEDLRMLIYALKEATGYKPVCVKIAAVHNVAAIASGIVRAGADLVYLDGFRGGTGAAPNIVRDHVGIPIEVALAVVDERLRQEGIRNEASIVAAGSIRSAADVCKAIALGADACAIGTAALIAMGCHVCQKCHTGKCSWGIATQNPELVRRLDPEWGAERLCNLLRAWSIEIKEVLGALGINAIESLRGNKERLRGVGLDQPTLEVMGIKPAGVGMGD